jgi:hypothetical protein
LVGCLLVDDVPDVGRVYDTTLREDEFIVRRYSCALR